MIWLAVYVVLHCFLYTCARGHFACAVVCIYIYCKALLFAAGGVPATLAFIADFITFIGIGPDWSFFWGAQVLEGQRLA